MSILITILGVLLGSQSYPVRSAASQALASVAAPADLLLLLDHADPETRHRASMLLDDLAGRDVRCRLASFAGLPYIDADPEWTLKGHQRHLAAAMAWHREHNLPVGEWSDWSEYRQAWRLAADAGDVSLDGVALAVMRGRRATGSCGGGAGDGPVEVPARPGVFVCGSACGSAPIAAICARPPAHALSGHSADRRSGRSSRGEKRDAIPSRTNQHVLPIQSR